MGLKRRFSLYTDNVKIELYEKLKSEEYNNGKSFK